MPVFRPSAPSPPRPPCLPVTTTRGLLGLPRDYGRRRGGEEGEGEGEREEGRGDEKGRTHTRAPGKKGRDVDVDVDVIERMPVANWKYGREGGREAPKVWLSRARRVDGVRSFVVGVRERGRDGGRSGKSALALGTSHGSTRTHAPTQDTTTSDPYVTYSEPTQTAKERERESKGRGTKTRTSRRPERPHRPASHQPRCPRPRASRTFPSGSSKTWW
jgi:hypothetical protein